MIDPVVMATVVSPNSNGHENACWPCDEESSVAFSSFAQPGRRYKQGSVMSVPRTPASRDLVADLPKRVVPPGTTRYGLVIGIDKYTDGRLNLRCAAADARAIRDLMVDPECGCFPPENVRLLLDHEATTENVFRALARLSMTAAENDLVWVCYAGHAAVRGDDAYWLTHDADVDDLFATALGSDRITRALSRLRSKRLLLILDCCHAAATALMKNPTRQDVTAKDVFGRFEGHGTITLAASDGKQRSVELSEVGHGAFTYFLTRGLRGEADMNDDGVVTADELWHYLRGKVTEASGRAGNLQTPMLIGAMTHDVALTLNAVATANKQRLLSEIEMLVGLRAHQLTTAEGRFCEEILLRGARTHVERSLLESLEELADGRLTPAQFRRLVQVAHFNMYETRVPESAESESRAQEPSDAESHAKEAAETKSRSKSAAGAEWRAKEAEVETRTGGARTNGAENEVRLDRIRITRFAIESVLGNATVVSVQRDQVRRVVLRPRSYGPLAFLALMLTLGIIPLLWLNAATAAVLFWIAIVFLSVLVDRIIRYRGARFVLEVWTDRRTHQLDLVAFVPAELESFVTAAAVQVGLTIERSGR